MIEHGPTKLDVLRDVAGRLDVERLERPYPELRHDAGLRRRVSE